ncbi:MAG: hypothetical protein Q9N34_02745 [Aquificota bacterium]|nr:hypothetical protein [Aquificota bacterium]
MNWNALLPEIVLSLGILLVFTLELFLRERYQRALTLISFLVVVASAFSVFFVNFPAKTLFDGFSVDGQATLPPVPDDGCNGACGFVFLRLLLQERFSVRRAPVPLPDSASRLYGHAVLGEPGDHIRGCGARFRQPCTRC